MNLSCWVNPDRNWTKCWGPDSVLGTPSLDPAGRHQQLPPSLRDLCPSQRRTAVNDLSWCCWRRPASAAEGRSRRDRRTCGRLSASSGLLLHDEGRFVHKSLEPTCQTETGFDQSTNKFLTENSPCRWLATWKILWGYFPEPPVPSV